MRSLSNNSEKMTENNARLFAPICRDPRSCEIKTFPCSVILPAGIIDTLADEDLEPSKNQTTMNRPSYAFSGE